MPRRGATVSIVIHEKWLYDAYLYGKPTADFIAGVETAIEVLPSTDRVAPPNKRKDSDA
jgi:hypothetical protein